VEQPSTLVQPLREPVSPRASASGCAEETDEALMLAYASGSTASFERLYARHRGATYRYFLRHTSSRSTAEELHQDTWMSVVRARGRYVRAARFSTWLYTLARHRLIDHWRATRATVLVELPDEDAGDSRADCVSDANTAADPLTQAIDAQAGQRLLAAIATVPPPQRDAFLLHVEAGLALTEIAAICEVPAETVKSRLRYAYRRLRAVLEDPT
jgi:RNA polymerase sigma factor (sigma-70 family)